jgi:hypothetical protein
MCYMLDDVQTFSVIPERCPFSGILDATSVFFLFCDTLLCLFVTTSVESIDA